MFSISSPRSRPLLQTKKLERVAKRMKELGQDNE
jgi:hypothetical protein